MPQESTDLRPAGTTPLAATHVGFGAAKTGGPYDAVSDHADSAQTAEPIIRAETAIRDDAPTPA